MMVALNPRLTEDFHELANAGLLIGKFPGIDGDDYHRKLPGTSKTSIELAAISIANMVARDVMNDDEESDSLLFGKVFHSRCEHWRDLEKYRAKFIVEPKFEGEGSRKAKKDWLESHLGHTILEEKDAAKIEKMFSGMMANPQSRKLLEAPGECEETVFWTDAESGVLCKARPDKRVTDYLGSPLVVDWKSIGEFGIKACNDAIREHNYHVSAAFTLDGLRAIGIEPGPYVFVFVHKKSPHQVLCVPARDNDINIGRVKYKQVLKQIAEYQRSGVAPGFVDAGLPDWFVQQEMQSLGQF